MSDRESLTDVPRSTLHAVDPEGVVMTFVDFVSEGDIVPIRRSFEDAVAERGTWRDARVSFDGAEWRLEYV